MRRMRLSVRVLKPNETLKFAQLQNRDVMSPFNSDVVDSDYQALKGPGRTPDIASGTAKVGQIPII